MGVNIVTKLVLIFFSVSIVASQGTWKLFAGLEYDVVLKTVNSYKQASQNCQAKGGILVVIPNNTVQQFLVKTIRQMSKLSPPLYIGLKRTLNGYGLWRWSDGRLHTAQGFSNWRSGEPNNWKRNENCVTFGEFGRTRWIDSLCNLKAGYICQRTPVVRNASNANAILPTTVGYVKYAKGNVKAVTTKATTKATAVTTKVTTKATEVLKTAIHRDSNTTSSTLPETNDDFPWFRRVFPNFDDYSLGGEYVTTTTATKRDSTVRNTTADGTSLLYIGIIAGLSALLVLSICANLVLCLKVKTSSKKRKNLMSTPTSPTINTEQTHQLELVKSLKDVQEDCDGYLVPNRSPLQLPGQVSYPDGAYIEFG